MVNRKQKNIVDGSLCLTLNSVEDRIQIVLGRFTEPSLSGNRDRCLGLDLLSSQSWASRSQGAETLSQALEDMFKILRLSPRSIGRVAVVRGPGSFTGIRLSTVSAAAFSRSVGCAQCGLDLMELLAFNAALLLRDSCVENPYAHAGAGENIFWVGTHARRGLLYLQGFSASQLNGEAVCKPLNLTPASELMVLSVQECREFLLAQASRAGRSFLLGSGMHAEKGGLSDLIASEASKDASFVLLGPAFNHSQPETLLMAGLMADAAMSDIAPFYVRSSDAEQNVEVFAAKLGLAPEEARQRLNKLTHDLPSEY